GDDDFIGAILHDAFNARGAQHILQLRGFDGCRHNDRIAAGRVFKLGDNFAALGYRALRLGDEAIKSLGDAVVEDEAAAGKFEIGRLCILAAGAQQEPREQQDQSRFPHGRNLSGLWSFYDTLRRGNCLCGRRGAALPLLYVLQQLLNALQVTVIYALFSAAFVLFYGVTNRLNFAFGALGMWAACVTIMMISLLEGVTFWPLSLIVIAGGIIALANTALLGFALHHAVIRPLIGRRMQIMLISTIAVAITLEEGMRLINRSRDLWLRPVFADPVPIVASGTFPVQATLMQILTLIIGFGAVLLL